ncbi:MAG: hypothetical protein ABGY41_20820 [Candidatus Poribacteria bacterium]
MPPCGSRLLVALAFFVALTRGTHAELGPVHRLLDGGARRTYPAWSPDGARIAYTDYSQRLPAVYVVGADGSNPRMVVGPTTLGGPPVWSPDSAQIAFSWFNSGHVWETSTVNSDGTDPVTLLQVQGGSRILAWSPDGGRLLYAAQSRDIRATVGLYTMNVDGSDPAWLTDDNGIDAAWSPDGRAIAYTDVTGHDELVWSVRVMPVNGDEPVHMARASGPT